MSEERLERIEERLLETETKLEEVITGQNMIYQALESGGLMKDGEPVKPRWDPEKIKWVLTEAQSGKGLYGRYPPQGQKAESTPDYRNMLQDLKNHGGKMNRGDYFYWCFDDMATVGRKKRKGKSQGEPKERSSSIQDVRAKFPQDLEELLNFSFDGKNVIIKPRRFLGSENFAKTVAIVRDLSGEYISTGKNSHFRVPVK